MHASTKSGTCIFTGIDEGEKIVTGKIVKM